MTRSLRLFTLVIATVLVACGGSTTSATSTTPTSARGQRPRSSVRVLTHGANESLLARYQFQGGETGVIRLQMDMGLAMAIGPQSVPRIALPRMMYEVSFRPVQVQPSGDFVLEFETTDVAIRGSGDLPPDAVAELRTSLAALRGLGGRYVISPRGELRSLDLDVPESLPESVRNQLDQFRTTLDDLVLVWPEEPIGVGTVFEVEKTIATSAIATRQRTRYRVTAIRGSHIELETNVQSEAEPQDLPSPASAPDTRIRLRSMVGRGTGRTEIDLGALGSTGSAHAEVTMEATITPPQGEPTSMTTSIDLDITTR